MPCVLLKIPVIRRITPRKGEITMAKKEDRFVKTLVDSGGFTENTLEIYVDRKTGVNYLFA